MKETIRAITRLACRNGRIALLAGCAVFALALAGTPAAANTPAPAGDAAAEKPSEPIRATGTAILNKIYVSGFGRLSRGDAKGAVGAFTPVAEAAIAGLSVGLAAQGFRPVAEIQFTGFIYPAIDQLANHAARLRTRTRGRLVCPMVLRSPCGGGVHAPEHHSESPEAMLAHIPGLRVVIPSSPARAYGLLLAAIAVAFDVARHDRPEFPGRPLDSLQPISERQSSAPALGSPIPARTAVYHPELGDSGRTA